MSEEQRFHPFCNEFSCLLLFWAVFIFFACDRPIEYIEETGDYPWDYGSSNENGDGENDQEYIGPDLPECLLGDDPPGCAEPPELPECLQGENPPGCAELPRMKGWDCPDGWNSVPAFVDENGEENVPEGMEQYTICEPPSLPEDCSDGFMPQLGSSECVHIGDTCPEGDFPVIPDEITGKRIYVKAGSNGDGSQSTPFGTIDDALTAAADGDVIVFGEGRYEESVESSVDVTLWGTCVEKTVIDAPGPYVGLEGGAIIVRDGIRMTLRNLSVTGMQIGIHVSGKNSYVNAQGVWVYEAKRHGVYVSEGTLEAENCYLSGMQPDPEADELGRGLNVTGGADAYVSRTSIEKNSNIGIWTGNSRSVEESTGNPYLELEDVLVRENKNIGLCAQVGANMNVETTVFDGNQSVGIYASSYESRQVLLNFSDVIVRNTQSETDGTNGQGMVVLYGSQIVVKRALFERNQSDGIIISSLDNTEPTFFKMSDTVVRDTQNEVGKNYGEGMVVQGGAQITIERALFERNQPHGLSFARFDGSTPLSLNLADTIIRDTGSLGWGMRVKSGAQVTAERLLFERNREVGIFVSSDNSITPTCLKLANAVVRDTQCNTDGNSGWGMSAQEGSQVVIDSAVFERNHDIGIFVSSFDSTTPTSLKLANTIIRNTQSQEDGTNGIGLNIQDGAQVTVEKAVFEKNREIGIFITNLDNSTPALLNLTDAIIRDTQSEEDGTGGRGMSVQDGAQVTVERAIFEKNREIGIYITGIDSSTMTSLSLTDTVIRETQSDVAGNNGRGLNIQDGAQVTVAEAVFERNREIGVFISGIDSSVPTLLNLTDTIIRDTQSATDGTNGRGIEVQGGAKSVVGRSVLLNNKDVSIYVYGESSSLSLQHAFIHNTLFSACGEIPEGEDGSCIENGENLGGGTGIAVLENGQAELRDFLISGSAQQGILISRGGQLEAHRGTITDNAIGVNVMDDTFDIGLMDDEVYNYGNLTDFARKEVPIPEPAELIRSMDVTNF